MERLDAAKTNITAFYKYPLSGTGFGQWIRLHELGITEGQVVFQGDRYKQDIVTLNPHNTILRIASDMGVFGLIALVSLLLYVLLKIKTIGKKLYRHNCELFDKALLCSKIALLNQIAFFMFGDYVESNILWSLFLAIMVFGKRNKVYEESPPRFNQALQIF